MRGINLITTKEVQYTKKIKTWHCDFCDYHTQDNRGCCGVRPVMTCDICGKHMCRKHTNHYQEDISSDYDDAKVCDACNVKFSPAWEWAELNAGRYEDIVEATKARMQNV